jgi:hypothetical protein
MIVFCSLDARVADGVREAFMPGFWPGLEAVLPVYVCSKNASRTAFML